MKLDYVPLLRVMREIHTIPRGQPPDFNGMKRFRQFVRAIFPCKKNGKIEENAVYLIPLLAINPMANDVGHRSRSCYSRPRAVKSRGQPLGSAPLRSSLPSVLHRFLPPCPTRAPGGERAAARPGQGE